MQAAIDAVKTGMGVNAVARSHGVPKTTLKDRISGRVVHGSKPGPHQYLTNEEEKNLAHYLEEVADIGYGKTRKQVQVIVEAVAKEKGLMDGNKKISDGWWRRFKERQSGLSLRKGDSTAAVRLSCTNAENLKQYFSLLGNILTQNDLLNKLAQLYNMDETGMPIDHKTPNVVAK